MPEKPNKFFKSGVIVGIQTAKKIVNDEAIKLADSGLQNHASMLKDIIKQLESKIKALESGQEDGNGEETDNN